MARSRLLRRASPLQIHRRLLAVYGPQGWWPTTRRGDRAPRYEPGRRRRLSEPERVEVCVGAILTQHAAWTGAETALARLRGALPRLSWRGLLALPEDRLASLVRPAGCHRQKARKLRALAVAAAAHSSTRAWLGRGAVAQRRDELLGLWGIGPETADKILLYAGGRPTFVLDAYARRIGERVGWRLGRDYGEAREYIRRRLPEDRGVYEENHALLVRLAKEHCRAIPACGGCPVRGACALGRRRA